MKRKFSLRSIFLIPMVVIVIFQSILMIAVLFTSGASKILENRSIQTDNQIIENRGVVLKNVLLDQRNAVHQIGETVNRYFDFYIETQKLDVNQFLSDNNLQMDFLSFVFEDFLGALQSSSTSGMYLVLVNNNQDVSPGKYNGFFLRDSEARSRISSNSDLLLERGPKNLARDASIPLDSTWSMSFSFEMNGERDADKFFYVPYLTALYYDQSDTSNLGYWAEPFTLENKPLDSHKMISYSLPLVFRGEVYAVVGMELSTIELGRNLWISNNGNNGGESYALGISIGDNEFRGLYGKGVLYDASFNRNNTISLETHKSHKDLFKVTGATVGEQSVYSFYEPLNLYPRNVPYDNSEWVVMSFVGEQSLFGVSRNLYGSMTTAAIICVIVAALAVYFIVGFVTSPIQRLMDSIRGGLKNLKEFKDSEISEVDELHSVILTLTEQDQENYNRFKAERVLYSDALTYNSMYNFKVDIDDGYFREEVYSSDGKPILKNLGIELPAEYDEVNRIFIEKNELVFERDEDIRGFSRAGLRSMYDENNLYNSLDYYIPSTDTYVNMMILLGDDPVTGHLILNAIAYDVSEKSREEKAYQKALEEAKLEAEYANLAKTQFMNNMSHDIRTPMNAIMGMTEIAMRNKDDRDRVEDCLAKIELSSKHLLSLINDVLDMSKMEEGKVELVEEPVDIVGIFEECLKMMESPAEKNEVEIIVHEDYKVQNRYILTSPLYLRQVFINLISNSIKYNKRGGSLEILCDEELLDNGKVNFTFIFRDTGIGMSPDFIERVFEPFAQEEQSSRTEFKGTGLGMSIVKKIVDLMGGSITVSSEKGVGSTFVLSVPFTLTQPPMDKKDSFISDAVPDLNGLKVLLVEDNILNMEIAYCLLTDSGAIVHKAENGREAIDMLTSRPEGSYDVILMDIMMPVLNGYAATQEIRSLPNPALANIPIVAMTANAYASDVKKCLDAGMNAHIAKPINLEKLFTVINWLVKNK